jgi:catechol 2,3-dioxygenase-like lactoylglutathione lyase family enzyme
MFSHIVLGTNDLESAKRFYDAILEVLGVPEGVINQGRRIGYRTATGSLLITKPINGEPATFANGATVGFACISPNQVHAWHEAGVANGGTAIEGPPGERANPPRYLAYLRDPDGNKLCALFQPKRT